MLKVVNLIQHLPIHVLLSPMQCFPFPDGNHVLVLFSP